MVLKNYLMDYFFFFFEKEVKIKILMIGKKKTNEKYLHLI